MGAYRTMLAMTTATFLWTVCLVLVGGVVADRPSAGQATKVIPNEVVIPNEEVILDEEFVLNEKFTLNEKVAKIRKMFPGYFRTPEEQARIEGLHHRMTPVTNTSRLYEQCYTKTQCPKTVPGSSKGPPPAAEDQRGSSGNDGCSFDSNNQYQLTFHACCVSRSYFDDLNYLPSAFNLNTQLQIAQFPGWGIRQYFEVQECCQQASCTICQCSQSYTHYHGRCCQPSQLWNIAIQTSESSRLLSVSQYRPDCRKSRVINTNTL